MSENILKLFIKKGFLLDKDMLNFLKELKDDDVASEIIDKIAVTSHKKVITKNLVNENIEKIKPIFFELDSEKKKLIEKYFVNVSISVEVKKETSMENENFEEKENNFLKDSPAGNVKVLSSPVSVFQKLEVRDFVRHFRNRYSFLKQIIQQKPELESLTSIDKISNNRNFSIIGMITSKQVTKNKNIILEVEDLTGKIKVLINQNKEEVFNKAKEILLDDVIGFKCSGTRDFLFVNDFFYPDAFRAERPLIEKDAFALFISDIHVGSRNFLEKNFERFIEWLNGKNEEEKGLIKKVKYLFVVGDSIDGVGIYPGQEKDLKIKDIKEQYVKLAEFYKKIPKHIQIIQCAGQHDAVRVAEPQPPIGDDFAEPLHKFENLHLVSNPSLVEIEGKNGNRGVRVLMYHGASMHNIVNEIEELRLNDGHSTPARIVKHLLLRRHLAPSHGDMIYIPDSKSDPMLIKEVPDIITTGDLHKMDIDKYNGILIISNSCWQSMTAFEEKVGNKPDYCKVPLLNLKTGSIKILDFFDAESKEEKCDVIDEKKEVSAEGDSEEGRGSDINKKEIVCEVGNG